MTPAVLDLHLYPLHIKDSVEQAQLPGLFFLASPRGANRSRQGDQLVILLSSLTDWAISSDRLALMLQKAANEYFSASGTVTSALRKAAELLNLNLLDYNIKESVGGAQQACLLNMAVRREDRVYVAHCGYTHTFILNRKDSDHFYDPETSGRGLGLSRNLAIRFFLAEIAADEYFIFSPDPLSTWTPSNLSGSPANALDYVRRRLLNQVSPNIRALLVQCTEGTGKIQLEAPLSSKSAYFAQPSPNNPPAPPAVQTTRDGRSIPVMTNPTPDFEPEFEPAPIPRPSLVTGQTKAVHPLPAADPDPKDVEVEQDHNFLEGLTAIRLTLQEKFSGIGAGFLGLFGRFKSKSGRASRIDLPKVNTAPMVKTLSFIGKTAGKAAASVGEKLQVAGGEMGGAVGGAFGNAVEYVTPEGGFRMPTLSAPVMLFIAVAIPLIVAAAGSTIYFQRGRSAQFELYYNQAQAIAAQANGDNDPAEVRSAWQQALSMLDQAEKYGKSEASVTLREQAQDVLDDVDGIARIDYGSAIVDGLPSSLNITRMESTTTDLYMLDSTEGKVVRALMTGRGYEVDDSFKCAPGPYGSYTVTPFIDMAIMPKGNSLGASVAAIDATGNMVYCASGVTATSITLLSPEVGWGKITGMTIDSGKLYVLDPGSNTIWVYYGSNGTFSESPNPFFDNDVPNLSDIADFSISGNDLFLLHTDGHLTECAFSDVSQTKCDDPRPFTIKRPNVENKPVIIPDTNFVQIQYSSPPDPSIYLLDLKSVDVYHLSLKVALQKQLSVQAGDPQGLLKKTPTAFTINPAKVIFLAFGNKVYSGVEP